MKNISLGLGLIGIGRNWGHIQSTIPTAFEVDILLEKAIELGICFFDTAPAYGMSEERLGTFLKNHSSVLDPIVVATKFGEFWIEESQTTLTDHSYAKCVASIDLSLQRLGKIDVLQLHKANKDVLMSDSFARICEYATSLKITSIGVSASDLETGTIALEIPNVDYIQIPFNLYFSQLSPLFDLARVKGKKVIINRPFNMGKLLYDESEKFSKEQAFAFIVSQGFEGVVLTVTTSVKHLVENVKAFEDCNI